MPWMESNRPDTVRTRAGHIVRFGARGTVKYIPDNADLVAMAQTSGHHIVDAPEEKIEKVDASEETKKPAPSKPVDRKVKPRGQSATPEAPA